MKKKTTLKNFMKRIEQLGITPNFYVSEPYLQLCGAECFQQYGWMWIEEGGTVLFPPVPSSDPSQSFEPPQFDFIWSDFSPHCMVNHREEDLDWQYIYDPDDFKYMNGGHWQVFRKNTRKWPRQNPNWKYQVESPNSEQAQELIGKWLEVRAKSAQDPQLLAEFAWFSDDPNINRKFLINGTGKLMAINAWDANHCYINYRICMVKNEERFLDEFARLLFYQDLDIINTGKLINDGGTLDNPNLEQFKDKLNPFDKFKIHSLKK